MKRPVKFFLAIIVVVLSGVAIVLITSPITPEVEPQLENNQMIAALNQNSPGANTEIRLPAPRLSSNVSIEEALQGRRSIRQYANKPLTLQEVSQLLWSAQGITNERGFRTAPSAGATFPLEIYLMVNNVMGLQRGIYHYIPATNRLRLLHSKDVARDLTRASLGQAMVHEAGAVIIFGAVYERTTQRYGERGIRYVYNEIGHASQNVHLQAVSLDLGTVVIGAFRDEEVEQILNLDPEVRVLYLMPVGKLN